MEYLVFRVPKATTVYPARQAFQANRGHWAEKAIVVFRVYRASKANRAPEESKEPRATRAYRANRACGDQPDCLDWMGHRVCKDRKANTELAKRATRA